MRILFIVLALATSLGCAATSSGPARPESTRTACTDIGWFFYVIGEYEANGATQNEQYLWANRAFERADSRHAALRIIQYVYADERAPLDLGVDVARNCRIEGEDATSRPTES